MWTVFLRELSAFVNLAVAIVLLKALGRKWRVNRFESYIVQHSNFESIELYERRSTRTMGQYLFALSNWYTYVYVCQRPRWQVYDTSLGTQDHLLNCWTPRVESVARFSRNPCLASWNHSEISFPSCQTRTCPVIRAFIRCKILRLRQFDSRRGNSIKRITLSKEILSSRPNLKSVCKISRRDARVLGARKGPGTNLVHVHNEV